MRSTSMLSVLLVAITICLPCYFCNSVWPVETPKTNPRIKELQQKRMAALENAYDLTKQLYSNASITYEEVHAAKRDLLAARLEYADTRKERIEVCDEAVQEAKDWLQFAQNKVASGRGTQIAAAQAEASLLETQIQREKAEADK